METAEEYQTGLDGILSERDTLMAAAVASGQTIRQAAASVNLSERQGRRIACQPAFRQVVNELRTQAVATAVGALSDFATKAAEKLTELTTCGDPAIELRSAVAILSQFSKLSESVDLRQRVELLEKQVKHVD
jgi:hypothetical protein